MNTLCQDVINIILEFAGPKTRAKLSRELYHQRLNSLMTSKKDLPNLVKYFSNNSDHGLARELLAKYICSTKEYSKAYEICNSEKIAQIILDGIHDYYKYWELKRDTPKHKYFINVMMKKENTKHALFSDCPCISPELILSRNKEDFLMSKDHTVLFNKLSTLNSPEVYQYYLSTLDDPDKANQILKYIHSDVFENVPYLCPKFLNNYSKINRNAWPIIMTKYKDYFDEEKYLQYACKHSTYHLLPEIPGINLSRMFFKIIDCIYDTNNYEKIIINSGLPDIDANILLMNGKILNKIKEISTKLHDKSHKRKNEIKDVKNELEYQVDEINKSVQSYSCDIDGLKESVQTISNDTDDIKDLISRATNDIDEIYVLLDGMKSSLQKI